MEFGVGFLNCHRLFGVGQHRDDSPPNDAQLQTKIRGLASGLRRTFFPRVPDLIGLCEVGAEWLAKDVLGAVKVGGYSAVWQKPPDAPDPQKPTTGLALAYNSDVFAVEETAPPELTPGEDHRYHWLAVRLRLRKMGPAAGTFWAVVNHWPSDFRSGPTRGAWPRSLVGKVLAEFMEARALSAAPAVLLMGDFNCEPFDAPLTGGLVSGTRLVSVREHARAMNERTTLPYFYNPMWRVLGEGIALERRIRGREVPPRPPGTYTRALDRDSPSAEWRCLDQILVNRGLMDAGPASLVEESVVISPTDPGASDHCVVGARFTYEARRGRGASS